MARHVVFFTVQGENGSRRPRQACRMTWKMRVEMLLSNLQGGAPQVMFVGL